MFISIYIYLYIYTYIYMYIYVSSSQRGAGIRVPDRGGDAEVEGGDVEAHRVHGVVHREPRPHLPPTNLM